MRNQTSKLVLTLISAAALSVGCSSAPGPASSQNADGGRGGNGGSVGTGVSIPLMPSATGYIDVMTNSAGIKGSWYAYGDGVGSTGMPPGVCQAAGHPDSACSKIDAPPAGSFPNTDGKMCTSGSVPVVAGMIAMPASPDYSKIFGAGIGVDLNNDGLMGKKPFNATAAGLVGFSFDIDTVPLAGLRVEAETVPTDGTTPGNDYWGATSAYPKSPVKPGTNVVMWKDIVGPMTHVFDPTMLEGLQFHVPTTTTSGATYTFCISNLKMLK